MRVDRVAVVLLAVLVPACTPVRFLTRPEGTGGWSAERRARELQRLARSAGVDLGTADPAPPRRGEPLTLTTALRLATQGNRRIAEARHRVAEAREVVRDQRGYFLPKTEVSTRYTRYTDPQTNSFALPGGGFPGGGGMGEVVVRDDEEARMNGTVTLPLNWLARARVLAAAQAGYRGEQARRWAVALEQELLVVRSYFQLLEADRLRDVTRQTLAVQREQLANAESRFRSGRLTKNQLLVVQVAVRETERLLLQRDLAIDQARWALNQAVGLAVDAPTRIADVREPPTVPSARESLERTWAHNPVVIALLEEQQRLEHLVTANVLTRAPSLQIGGAIDYSTSDILQPQRVGSGFIETRWDLDTNRQREARIARARIDAERNRVVMEAELRELEVAVRSTQRAAEERLAALATAESAVEQAEENLRIRRQQFGAGRAASEDVLDAERLLASQRATAASALYQAHTRRAELQRLTGLPLER